MGGSWEGWGVNGEGNSTVYLLNLSKSIYWLVEDDQIYYFKKAKYADLHQNVYSEVASKKHRISHCKQIYNLLPE